MDRQHAVSNLRADSFIGHTLSKLEYAIKVAYIVFME